MNNQMLPSIKTVKYKNRSKTSVISPTIELPRNNNCWGVKFLTALRTYIRFLLQYEYSHCQAFLLISEYVRQ